MSGQPGGTLTVLFTDLVDSTEHANRLGDTASQALRRAHDRILREQCGLHFGTVVKGTGDGFLLTFPTARQGLECAIAIQREIATQQEEGRYLELGVRIGVHTGEPTIEDGDVFGIDVTLAARLMSDADGGEILLSEVTRLLVHQHAFHVEPAGERRLKGFPEPVPSFRLLWTADGRVSRRLSRFVGRGDEQSLLLARLDEAFRGRGGMVLLGGEPGIGKTRLANELALVAQDRGALVATGRVYEPEGLPPYFPLSEAFGELLRDRSGVELLDMLGHNASHVARLVPELRDRLPATEALSAQDENERHLLFDSVGDLLERLASNTPVVVILDDLQWVDHATIHLLQYLLRRLAEIPVLVVGTYRDADLGSAHPLIDLVAEVRRRGPGEVVMLEPLSRNATHELLRDILGEEPSASTEQTLYDAAAGNPYFTEELARQLHETHGTEQPAASTHPVPESIRMVVQQRLSLLTEDARDLLMHCAILGHDLTWNRIRAVINWPETTLLDLIEQSIRAHALKESKDGFTFVHPLIRETLYQDLIDPRRRLLHRHTGEALEGLYTPTFDQHSAELAHHFLEGATDVGSATKAVAYAEQAAERAVAVFAYEDAGAFYQLALKTLERIEFDETGVRCDLLLSLGEAQTKAGNGAGAEQSFRQAAAIAEADGLPEALARSAIGYHQVRGVTGSVDDFLIHLVGEACRALSESDSPLRARLLAIRSSALYHVEPHETLTTLSEEALAMARRLGDPPTLVWVLGTTHAYRYQQHDAQGRLESAGELLRLADLHGPREMVLLARRYKIVELLQLGDIRALDAELEVLERDANEMRLPLYLWLVAVCHAMRALLAGELATAEQLAQDAYSIGQEVQRNSGLAYQFLAIQLFALRREQGRLGDLLPVVQSFVDQYPALRWRVGVAYVYCDLGRYDEAQEEFEHLAAGDFADLPLDFNWLISATILAEVCAQLKDARRASLLYDLLLPYADQTAVIGDQAACNGAVSRYLGLLATTMCDWDVAARHFEAAIEMNERMGARPFVAHSQQDFAAMLLARGEPADRERAHAYLDEAEATAKRLGMHRLIEEVAQLRQVQAT